MALYFASINFSSKTYNKNLTIKIDSAASSRPRKEGLSISKWITLREIIHNLTNIAILSPKKEDCTARNDQILQTSVREQSAAKYQSVWMWYFRDLSQDLTMLCSNSTISSQTLRSTPFKFINVYESNNQRHM
jgi:hypothetical protein